MMIKKSRVFLLLLLLIGYQIHLNAISKDEYLNAFQKLDEASPEYACLSKKSFDSCDKLMIEFNKPIYLNKLRDIVSSSLDIDKIDRYLKLEKDQKYILREISKLRNIGTKDSLFVAYKNSHSVSDLNRLLKKLNSSGKTSNYKILNEYYKRYVINIDYFPKFIQKFSNCSNCDLIKFRKKAIYLPNFLDNISTLDDLFDSIEYRYVLKDIGYKISYDKYGKKYKLHIKTRDGKQLLTLSFDSDCKFVRNTTKREETGFFEGFFGGGGATEKDVSYKVEECRTLNATDKNKIYRLYANANQLDSFNSLKKFSWKFYIKTGQSYIHSVHHKDSYCYSSSLSDRDRQMCLANVHHEDSYCYSSYLSDRDRQMCLANVYHDDSYCFSSYLRDSDRDIKMCLANVYHDDSYCYSSSLSDRDRQMCLANVYHEDSYCHSSYLRDSDRDIKMCLANAHN